MQAELQIAARGQNRVRIRRKVGQESAELSHGLRRLQLMQIVDDQNEGHGLPAELGYHPVDHHPAVETGRRRCRFRVTGRAGGPADGVEQRKPESLSVMLVPLDLEDGEPVQLTRAVCPGAQERRLPAAGRSRDDRDFPLDGTVESSEKSPRSISFVGDTVLSVSGKRVRCQRRAKHLRGVCLRPVPGRGRDS